EHGLWIGILEQQGHSFGSGGILAVFDLLAQGKTEAGNGDYNQKQCRDKNRPAIHDALIFIAKHGGDYLPRGASLAEAFPRLAPQNALCKASVHTNERKRNEQ